MSSEYVLLPDDAVSDLQALSESNLPHVVVRATLARATGVRVGGALVDPTPVLLFENERCRLTPTRPASVDSAGQSHPAQAWTLVLRRGLVLPPGAIALVRGQDRAMDPQWERSVRVVDTQSQRMVTSVARFAVVDAGPSAERV